MKLRKGDKVRVMAGKDKGREGTIDRVYAKQEKVVLQGINMYKRHVKKSQEMPQGGIIDIPRPIVVSNLMFICPKCKKPTRVGYKIEKNKKIRICKKCNKAL